jgi:glycosyltransferase involved in cell wall biosynthesis
MEEQVKLGCQPAIASIGDLAVEDKPLEVEARRRGLAVVKFRMRRGLNVAGAFRIAGYARRNGFEIIHSHGYNGNILLGLMPRRVRRVAMISTLHGWTGQQRVGRMAFYQWLDRLALHFVDRVVVVSESMLGLRGVRTLRRVSVVRNGIDVAGPQEAMPRVRADTGKVLIGAAGRLSAEKGFHFLIEAFSLVRRAGLDAQLTIVGEGPERGRLERIIDQTGLADHVRLPGFRDDMQGFLYDIDVFVLSSLTEGAPMSVLEAMRAGTPIVATEVGGIPEMLEFGRAGLLVKPGDVVGLANAIGVVRGNAEETRRRTERAQDRVKEKYNSRIMAEAYCDLYASIGRPE